MGRVKNKINRLISSIISDEEIIKRYNSIYQNNNNISFSQEGEDMILARLFEAYDNCDCFYIDVGAHHPIRFSNTYKFYMKGWRGINLDPMPGCMNTFNELRPRDINIEAAISNFSEELVYHIFNEPALNTFSKEQADSYDGLRDFKLIEQIKIRTRKLSDVLDEHLPSGTKVSFMTIDVEGLEMSVLTSNDWERFRPSVLLLEILKEDLENLHLNDVYVYLHDLGYKLVAKTCNTAFLKDTKTN